GPACGNGWQVSADRGTDAASNRRDRTHAAGGQLGVTYLPWFLAVNFHGFYEYDTRNRFPGSSLGLSLAKKFGGAPHGALGCGPSAAADLRVAVRLSQGMAAARRARGRH